MPSNSYSIAPECVLANIKSGRVSRGEYHIQGWIAASWQIGVEMRSLVEDMEGGTKQPALQQLCKLRFVELLFEVEQLLGCGTADIREPHALAIAFEYGFGDFIRISGEELLDGLKLRETIGHSAPDLAGIYQLWTEILRSWPGEIPNPLVPNGQIEMLRALRDWSTLGQSLDIDLAFLVPLMREA